ncbi:PAS domain-containing sensor histidine kinase [Halorubrum sp. DTA46]|uniref:PAS domain-containing sensor histidine kinase n=1 Tax=Halorubrum sp. DTA46 TaxID=3402162 RepID=UPI003AAE111C
MTDGTHSERKLRRYETILESVDDAVYAVRPDGTIAYVNDRYAEMKGVPREELIDTQIYDWVTEETAAKAQRVRREVAEGEREAGAVEYEFLTADGDRFPVEMRFTRVTNDEGEELDRVGAIRDIREQRRRENALREKNERLDEFASIVSHDLRNPLTVASGRLDLAREECDSEHLDAVARAHDRMETLIEDLLTLARDGEGVEAFERVDLAALVAECWEGVDTGGATLEVETDQIIQADRSRLKQLFENLVRNAVDHAGDGVTIAVGDLGESGSDDGNTGSDDTGSDDADSATRRGFYVADDGPGIPPSDRDRIFENGYSTVSEGTGFGLSIVERVADAHGWTVRVTDAAGGGARFEFAGVDVLDRPS